MRFRNGCILSGDFQGGEEAWQSFDAYAVGSLLLSSTHVQN